MSSKEIHCEFSNTENSKKANSEKMKDDTVSISETEEFKVQDHTHLPNVADFLIQSGILAVEESNSRGVFLNIEENLRDGSLQETEEFKVQDNTHVPKVTDSVILSGILDGDESSSKDGFLDEDKGRSLNIVQNLDGGSFQDSEKMRGEPRTISESQECEVQDNINVLKVTDFAIKNGILAGDESNYKDGFFVKCLNVEDNLGDGSFQDTEVAVRMKDETGTISEGVSATQEFELSTKKEETNKGIAMNIEENLEGSKSVRCLLKIEVIDDTAMIDVSQAGKRTNRKKKDTNQGNGEKRVAKKGNFPKMVEAEEKNVLIDGCIREGEEKRVYSRKELENLRFIGMEEQRKKWLEVYCGLGHAVQKEYDALLHSNNSQKHGNPRRHRGKENTPVISGGLVANKQGKHLTVYTQRSMTYGSL